MAPLYRLIHFAAFRWLFLSGATQVPCKMTTLSGFIDLFMQSEPTPEQTRSDLGGRRE